MSTLGIFIAGVAVTLVVGTALALVVWAAVQDGKTQQAEDEGRPHDLDETVSAPRTGMVGERTAYHLPVAARVVE
jgi:hypothetical protein